MRDPMGWSVPVFRAFGIPVRVHLLFFLVTLSLFLRQVAFTKNNPVGWADVLLVICLLPFLVVLLHEFGHCFGARAVDGEATGILIWPLGGLAFNDIPHGPRPLFITVAAGPAVNVLICLGCAAALAAGGFLPNANPFSNPYVAEVYNFADGRVYTSKYGLKLYDRDTATPTAHQQALDKELREQEDGVRQRSTWSPERAAEEARQYGGDRALAPRWVTWTQRVFFLSWVIFLFNLLPAYPLDGGQLLQAVIWARSDHRRGVTVAAYSGLVTSIVMLVAAMSWNESMLMGLALFMMFMAATKLQTLDAEDGPFGYDFSAGYTSLEKDDEPAPKPKRPGPWARWWQARKARKLQRQTEQRQQDNARMDQLLAKITATGKGSLTDDERRFMDRFSADRKRNPS